CARDRDYYGSSYGGWFAYW
nr:immunoglobulin heavy chain junction region [Mus musculus]